MYLSCFLLFVFQRNPDTKFEEFELFGVTNLVEHPAQMSPPGECSNGGKRSWEVQRSCSIQDCRNTLKLLLHRRGFTQFASTQHWPNMSPLPVPAWFLEPPQPWFQTSWASDFVVSKLQPLTGPWIDIIHCQSQGSSCKLLLKRHFQSDRWVYAYVAAMESFRSRVISNDEVQTFVLILSNEHMQRELDRATWNKRVYWEVSEKLATHGYTRTYNQIYLYISYKNNWFWPKCCT